MALYPLIGSIGPYASIPTTTPGSSAWPSANRIYYVPVRIPEAFTVLRVWWLNGSSVTGNVDVGLYNSAGTRLWQLGSTAQSGTNVVQFADIGDQAHAAGLYYMAMQHSSNGNVFRVAPGVVFEIALGIMEESAGGFALPATATFAKAAGNWVPQFGLDLRGTV